MNRSDLGLVGVLLALSSIPFSVAGMVVASLTLVTIGFFLGLTAFVLVLVGVRK